MVRFGLTNNPCRRLPATIANLAGYVAICTAFFQPGQGRSVLRQIVYSGAFVRFSRCLIEK